MDFEIIGDIANIEVIATEEGILDDHSKRNLLHCSINDRPTAKTIAAMSARDGILADVMLSWPDHLKPAVCKTCTTPSSTSNPSFQASG